MRKTLAKSGFLASFLAEDLGNDVGVDDAGLPFLDRDAELFAEVLRLLRGYPFRHHPRLTWCEVRKEAEFYLVPGLEALGPPPKVVLPPPTEHAQKLWIRKAPTRKTHWLVTFDSKGCPEDLHPPRLCSPPHIVKIIIVV